MEDNKKYIISLDNIDISNLPLKRLFEGNDSDTVPIWSVTTNKSSDEFCEFELLAKEQNSIISECDENNSIEQCYICDTSVPTAYKENHYTSDKHRTYAAIIRHAQLRATQHAQSAPRRYIGSTSQSVPLAHSSGDVSHFCNHCSLVVKLKNKDAHEKTKEHQVSVIHDRLLNGLLITYLDKNKVIADSRYEAKAVDTSDDSSVEDDVNDHDDVAKTSTVDTDITDDEPYTFDLDKGTQSNLEEYNNDETIFYGSDRHENQDVKTASYLTLCDETKELCDVNWNTQPSKSITNQTKDNHKDAESFVEQNTVEIITMKGFTVKVAINNYHGFVKTSWGAWAEEETFDCLICQKVAIDIDKHKLEPHHVEFISKPVLDADCVREINEVWHHCMICNMLVQIQHKQQHISTSSHKNNIHPLELARKKRYFQNKAVNMFHCDICTLLRTNNTAKNCVLHYHLKKIKGEVMCIICNVLLHDNDIDKHIKSNAHDVSNKIFLVENQITIFNERFRCVACNYTYKQNHITSHVKSMMHKIKLSVYKPKSSAPVNLDSIEDIDFLDFATVQSLYLFESSDEPKKVRCKVCKVKIKSKSASVKRHLRKNFHKFNLEALLLVNKIKIEHDSSYFCEVCRIPIDFATIIGHINNDDHMKKVRNVPLSWRKKAEDLSRETTSLEYIPTSKVHVSDHIEKLDARQTEMGIETKEYANETLKQIDSFEFKQSVQMNKLRSIEDYKENNMYETDDTKSVMQKPQSFVNKLKSSISIDVNLLNEIDFDDDIAEFLYLFESSEKLGTFRCKVCKVYIKSISSRIKKHVTKQHHQSHLEFLLVVNKIKNELDGTYFCEVCRSTIDFTKEIDHINSDEHLKNMTLVKPSSSWKDDTIDNTKENDHRKNYNNKRNVRNGPLSWREREERAAEQSSVATPSASILDANTDMGPTEMSTKTNECVNKSFKPMESHKFKQLLQMNKLRAIDDGVYFCDLCAMSVATGILMEHIHCKTHLDKLVDNSNEADKNMSQYYCEACQTYLSNIYYIIDIHNRSKEHLKNLQKNKNFDSKEHKMVVASSYFVYNNMLEPADKRRSVKCKVCQHTMKNSEHKIMRHMESSKHLNSLKLLFTKNRIQIQFTGKNLCEFCNDYVEIVETLDHINSEKHKNNSKFSRTHVTDMAKQEIVAAVKEQRNDLEMLKTIENQPINTANKLSVGNDFTVHEVKTQSYAATSNKATVNPAVNFWKNKVVSSKLISYKVKSGLDPDERNLQVGSITGSSEKLSKEDMNNCLSEVPSKPSEVMCVICNTVVPKTDLNIRGHLTGKRHNSNFEKFLRDSKQATVIDKSSCDININVTEENVTKHAKNDSKAVEDSIFKYVEGVLFCRCCNAKVTCTDHDINTHLTGWRHKVKSSAMLAENGLRVDKDKIYCDMCEVYLPNLNGITHIDSISHITKASAKAVDNTTEINKPKSDNCENNENPETRTLNQKSQDTNLLKAKQHEAKRDEAVFCKSCKVYVLNMAVHLEGEQHKSVVKPLVVEKDYICGVCKKKKWITIV